MNWLTILLIASVVAFGLLAQHYKMQRDDLAAWAVHTHPEDFE